jgi:hypothetical protein
MTYYRILDKTNKTGVTNGVGTAYPSGEAAKRKGTERQTMIYKTLHRKTNKNV